MGGVNTKQSTLFGIAVDQPKVKFYSKDNFQGNVYEVAYGNYTSNMFTPKISPDNVFSMTIPPATFVKLYCGDMYDYGGKGFIHITNVTDQDMYVPVLPDILQGNVRSLSIGKHIDSYGWSGTNMANRFVKTEPSGVPLQDIVGSPADTRYEINDYSQVGSTRNNFNGINDLEQFTNLSDTGNRTYDDIFCILLVILIVILILILLLMKAIRIKC